MIPFAGLAVLLAGLSVLYLFRLPTGQTSPRSEWADTALALIASTAIGFGLVTIAAGLFRVF